MSRHHCHNEIILKNWIEFRIFFFFLDSMKLSGPWHYTEYAGCAITTGIPVKFDTAHGRSRPEVGSTKCIGACGEKGVPRVSRIFGTSSLKKTPPTNIFRTKQNFYTLTVCRLEQYLQNGNENKVLLP